MTTLTMNSAPIACNVMALSAGEREAHFALTADLFISSAQASKELADGYGFQFDANLFDKVTTFVANERKCCPFITFAIEVPPQHSAIWLRLTGSQEIKAFLRTEFKL